ncbi:MAG: heparan-alpha-glucosaminide N-acetyltransferase domain-containing protein [Micrococcaceae bacterium]|nr:heparan-alpha-glucosaminide N-acetyltransferase domain-containing protein [Micrococcaceae bacterium]
MSAEILDRPTARTSKRITGLDAARGIALMGMIAIHVLPSFTEDFEPTLVWRIASGTSAALFAFLAGVGLSLAMGKRSGSGPGLRAAKAALATRGVLIAAIGLLLGQLVVPAAIILVYYGVMFALAVPLLGLSARALFAWSIGFASIGAIVSQLLGGAVPTLGIEDPSLSSVFTDFGGTLGTLFVGGSFPALTWMTYICAGLAVGRLDLASFDVQLRLFLAGVAAALSTAVFSALLLGPLGIRDRLAWNPGERFSPEEVGDILTWGPLDDEPLLSGWWQVMLSPYSHSMFELINTLGVALAVFAAMVFIGQRVAWLLTPLSILGSMTLSLYAMHLVFLSLGVLSDRPFLSFWIQCGAGLLFALLWRNVTGRGRGPLEQPIALAANRSSERALASGRHSR